MRKTVKIQLASTDQCTGCSACASICSTNSITMREDREGFLQPHIDTDTCIKCHKCEKTCPIISPITIPTDFETQAFAAINKDEAVRLRSSSGGMFHALAKWTIMQGGVVFGARFNDQWEVVHDYTETIEGIEPFMRSKYVQSRIGDTFKQAKQFLDAGRQVLFVGTPCQIGGLKAYLKKEYDNLLAVDLICHGVPSPKVWRASLSETIKEGKLSDIIFRDKQEGWRGVRLRYTLINSSSSAKDLQYYANGFLDNYFLQKCCYNCKFKTVHRNADITLADAWGIENYAPNMDDNKGTSLLLVHTAIGYTILSAIVQQINLLDINITDALKTNKRATTSVSYTKHRTVFYLLINIFPVSIVINGLLKIEKYKKKILKRLIKQK